MVFDDEFVKKLPPAKQYANPWAIAMCKLDHNKNNRGLVEKWFINLPDSAKPNFKKRLNSLDDKDFISAFYELMMHQYCIEEGWKVEYEPAMDNGYKPDLRVTTQSGYQFVIEVTAVFDSDSVEKSDRSKDDLTHQISAIITPFMLSLDYYEHLISGYYSTKAILTKVKNWLDGLDASNPKKRHKRTFKGPGYNFQLEAMLSGRKAASNCVWAVMDPGGSVPNYSKRIKSKLDDKARKFGSKNTKMPLVIMLADGVGGRVSLDSHAIDKTLFGDDAITFSINGNEPPKAVKARNGYFTPSNNEKSEWLGKNTSVSAVLYGSLRGSGSYQMQMFHNPVPHISLNDEVFFKMPQLQRVESEEGIKMKWVISNPENHLVYFSQ